MPKFKSIIEFALEQYGYIKQSRISEVITGTEKQSFQKYEQTPANFGAYLKQYADSSWVYACVYTIANTIAGIPLLVFREGMKDGQITRTPVVGSEFQKKLNKPNADPNDNYYNMMEFTVANSELTGNGYWLLDELISNTKPKNIYALISSSVRVVPSGSKTAAVKMAKEFSGKKELKPAFQKQIEDSVKEGDDVKSYIAGYVILRSDGGDPIFIDLNEMLHLKYMSPSNKYYGQSALGPGRWSVDTLKHALNTNLAIFKNGAKLDGVLETDSQLNDRVYDRLKDEWNRKYVGEANAHKTGILEKGLKWKAIQATLKDLEYIDGTKLNREEVCAIFGVPPVLVGILDKATYSNYKESVKVFYKLTIIPKLHKIELFLQTLANKFDPTLRVAFDLSNVEALKDDEKIKSEIAKTYHSTGIPINDIIKKLNLPFEPVVGGDVGYLPINLVPLGESKETPGSNSSGSEGNEEDDDEGEEEKTNRAAHMNKVNFSEERKTLKWERFVKTTKRIEDSYVKIIDRFFGKLERDIIKKIKAQGKGKKGVIDVDAVVFDPESVTQDWTVESNKIHTVALEETGKSELAALGIETAFDLENPRVTNFLKLYSTTKAKDVVGNLAILTRTSLAEGNSAGESIEDLTDRVENIYDPYKAERYKARRIAQTEVIGASNQGALEAYEQSGVVDSKSWLTSGLPNVRDTHVTAGGKYNEAGAIPLGEPFIVGAAQGTAPGQMNSAAEDINCHCTLLPVVKVEDNE